MWNPSSLFIAALDPSLRWDDNFPEKKFKKMHFSA
jgi:hypothetical protein